MIVGGGVIAAGELLLAPGARGGRRAGPAVPARTSSGSSPAHFGVEAGMVGAGALALEDLAAAGAAAVSGRLIVCPTPIGNLEDITLRVARGPA